MLISIKANCIDSTAPPEQVFAAEVEKLRAEKFFPKEQLTLEPYERDHAVRHLEHCHATNKWLLTNTKMVSAVYRQKEFAE